MIIVFTGPTLSPQDARAELEAIYLPPVSQGDVYRAALKRPRSIGIIDGYFNRVPAVWHKEILWAMSQGIHVFGSASMGALRAAELDAFGMEGVGKIFELYRDGDLLDDDEVALVHGPAEFGHRPLSEAMVNIRCTLSKAEAAGVISPTLRMEVEQVAKSLFYPYRQYDHVLNLATQRGLPHAELETLRSWLPVGKVNQKRDDAIEMLRVMRRQVSGDCAPKEVDYAFEHTTLWEELTRYAGDLQVGEESNSETLLLETLIEELQTDEEVFSQARERAMVRVLASDEARRHDFVVDEETLYETIISFRRSHNLIESEDLGRWMEENRLSREQFIRLMGEEAKLKWVKTMMQSEIDNALPSFLRITGRYAGLCAKAREKQRDTPL